MTENAAESLFVEHLRRGPGADFEALCDAHPRETARLHELRVEHENALARLRAAGLTAIPPPAYPSSAVLRAASPASGDLLRRMLAQGSKGARYQLRGEIARGGMGAILRVWDEDLGRELAMKVVLGSDGQQADPTTSDVDGRRVSRFLEEAQITGQLDHPCVVPVHELGLDAQARVYFTMRLVKGRDFGRILELVQSGEEGWSRTRALNVLLRVCEAMAYAHSKGVVHRDLKPANVMVGKFGEVYVMDWGVARVLGRADAHDIRPRDPSIASGIRTSRSGPKTLGDFLFMTMDGDVMGTPAYMPPEQARGKTEEIAARSDVYAIGAMLYHLLAGRTPFVGPGESKSNADILHALLDGPPAPLRSVCPDLPAELEAICEKAMARSIDARYGDTLELADDLRAFLEGRVVKAYQTGAIVELRKWVARNKPLAIAGAAAAVFLVAGLIGSLWQKSVADENAVLAAERAEEANRKGALATANAALAEQRAGEAAIAATRAGAVRDFLTNMIEQADPMTSLDRNLPVSRVIDEAARKLDEGGFAADPATEFALRSTLGSAYQGIGRFEESERQYLVAAELLASSPDTNPFVPIELDVELAETLVARGRFPDSERHAVAALGALDALGDPGSAASQLRARSLMIRATCRYNQGDTAGALALGRAAISVHERLNGPDSEVTASARVNLVFYMVQSHLHDEALVEVERALAVLQQGTPRARVQAASALRSRAGIHGYKRRRELALADLEEALRIRRELYGEDSPFVAEVYEDLAGEYMVTREQELAESYARKAVEVRRRSLGDHRDTANSLSTLGVLARRRGAFEEARALLVEALEMRRRVFGPEASPIGDSLRRLARVSLDEGDLESCERLLRESCANWEKSLGPEHRDLAENWIELGQVLHKQGRTAEARPYLERALALRKEQIGFKSAPTGEARDALIVVLLESRDWTAAETFLRAELPLLLEQLPAGHPLGAYTGAQLGGALVGLARYDEAEPLLLAGWKAIGDDERMWAVNKLFILDNLVRLYEARGDEASAAPYRERAAALRR